MLTAPVAHPVTERLKQAWPTARSSFPSPLKSPNANVPAWLTIPFNGYCADCVNVPSPFPISTVTAPEVQSVKLQSLAAATSAFPSPLKSPTTIDLNPGEIPPPRIGG